MTVPQALIEAATAYEALSAPALFRQWAPIVAEAARIKSGDRVLDVACGTGVLARVAAARSGQTGHIVGIDPHTGMLAVAKGVSPAIDWQKGTTEALPLPDCSFDAVVCQFGLIFFSDRNMAVREMLRVMVPGGRCAVAVWDTLENAPAFAALVSCSTASPDKAADGLPSCSGTDKCSPSSSAAQKPNLSMSRLIKAQHGFPSRTSS
ncbi:methyltransferase domain-containing protein [Bradyrhizobium sp. LA6.12]|uniref:methyltransferase domain-containing protein n=1 Tax=unclassified Bradyrhizobium TaxID=2631580 RepID=UPI00339173D2